MTVAAVGPRPENATASEAVRDYTKLGKPTTSYMLSKVAELDDLAKMLRTVTLEQLEEFQRKNIEKRAATKARSGVPALLEELTAERGMSWVHIARLVGVSVTAVRKWRKGGDATPDSRLGLARLAAMLDLLEELAVADPAQWMEIPLPLPSEYQIAPLDLYERGALPGILSIASNRLDAEEVLSKEVPGWRNELRNEFQIVQAPDGMTALQRRSPR